MIFREVQLVLFTILLCTDQVHGTDCKKKDFSESSFVCECTANYCDDIDQDFDALPGQYIAYTSTKDELRLNRTTSKLVPDTDESGDLRLTINRTARYQKVLGFGGAFTDSATINIMKLSESVQEHVLNSYFSKNGIEYNMGRIPMASCDFSTRNYSYDDVPGDFNLTNFALAMEDLTYKIPIIKRAEAVASRPIKLFGSPWGPPFWMKTNQDMTGGAPLYGEPGGKYYKTWALYFARFIEEYAKKDVTIWGLTGENEPTAGEVERYLWQCLYFNASMQRDFIKLDLGPQLAKSGFSDVKLMILDDQRFLLPGWAETVLSDEEAAQYVSGIAVHWYYDDLFPASVLTQTHELFPDYFMLGTEACEGYLPLDRAVILGSWERGEAYSKDIIEDMNNFVAGWVDWNLVLDMEGGPNWVSNFVDAPIIADLENDVIYKQPMFYHLAHLSKFVEPDSVRIGVTTKCTATSGCNKFDSIAFELPDESGRVAVVVSNRNNKQADIKICETEVGCIRTTVASRSIQTFIYTNKPADSTSTLSFSYFTTFLGLLMSIFWNS
ncbi:lysosomal acid glucosylceramidase-like [Anneissia japonica]|uniref:lysosomal acid glucosylceramidase-like n=1 Tax=Anneissia japonica TaxID=1529436 RepID=UPI001425A5C3|nr:lysosomal acid glucosylceramidase-like [Anneissia japonica]